MAGRFAGQGGSEHLLSESVAGAGPVLRCDEGGEVTAADVAEEPLGSRVEPPDDSRRVDDVARDADVLQSLLDVTADLQAGDHLGSVTDPGSGVG